MVSVLQRDEIEESYVHCLAYNFFGNRLAICFADANIQVCEIVNNTWTGTCRWNSNHSGAINKVRWANPEFGSILATCSFDKTVIIFEENPIEKSWKKISQLVESREPIEDIQFSPVHLPMQLAVCSSNGEIRIYEPTSAVNLKSWNNTYLFTASALGSNVLAWNPSNLNSPMLLIGNNDMAKAQEKFCKAFENEVESLQMWGLSDDGKQWEKIFVPSNGHEKTVVEISWAQLMGRSRHIVASASSDGVIIIWRIDGKGHMEIEETLLEPSNRVYSLGWDLMGTMLSSTGASNMLIIWKKTVQGNWVIMQEVKQ